jgi:hypothetical protein
MRVALVALLLAVAGVASALNLALGGFWVAAFVAIALARRRIRSAATLALVAALGVGALARWAGLGPPHAISYQMDELAWIRSRLPGAGHPGLGEDGRGLQESPAFRRQLDARSREELAYALPEIERRAAAAIAGSRRIGRLRDQAPAEVGTVEEAVRRLALTLTAPEFSDLDGRRARLRELLQDADRRLRMARDDAEREAVLRALDPAVIAAWSFRPLAQDLGRAEQAMRSLVRAVTGRELAAAATARVAYHEGRAELHREDVYRLTAPPPLAIRRIEAPALRQRGSGPGTIQALTYQIGDGEARPLAETGVAELAPAADLVTLVATRVAPADPVGVRTALRPVTFHRLVIDGAGAPLAIHVTTALGDPAGTEVPLVIEPAPPAVAAVTLPRWSLHYTPASGTLGRDDQHDRWSADEAARAPSRPGPPGAPIAPIPLAVELLPPTRLMRNAAFAAARVYLYTPNLYTAAGAIALAAVAHLLVRRRRGPAPLAVRPNP